MYRRAMDARVTQLTKLMRKHRELAGLTDYYAQLYSDWDSFLERFYQPTSHPARPTGLDTLSKLHLLRFVSQQVITSYIYNSLTCQDVVDLLQTFDLLSICCTQIHSKKKQVELGPLHEQFNRHLLHLV